MKREYFCPSCRTTLNPNVKIVLTASWGEQRGLVLLSPQPGNYQAFISKELAPPEGARLSFSCPVCQASLHSTVDKNLAELGYRTSHGETGSVDFSRVCGEHATYFVNEDDVRAFGENAGVYGARNFFGEGDVD